MTQKMIAAATKNPFPSGGVTRPGIDIKALRDVPSQTGSVDRIEELVRSVAAHGTVKTPHEGVGQTFAGKPEFVTLTGPFGSGKTLTLRKVYDDCRNNQIRFSEEEQSKKVLALPIYQPLHALIKEPGRLIDILTERLEVEAPTPRVKDAIAKARTAQSGDAREDELLFKINRWRRCVDAGVANGTNVVVVLLDELEESVEDYDRFADEYRDMMSEIREFTDREVGPVLVVLATTPNALRAIVARSKQAMFRRMVPLELLRLTSPEELLSIVEEYDPDARKYLSKDALNSLYAETRGIPGYSLAALAWAWEEMRAQKKSRIDPDLVYSAAQTVTWKGQSVARETENVPQNPKVKQLLETVKPAAEKVLVEEVVKGAVLSLSGIASVLNAELKTYQMMREEMENRGTMVAENSMALTWVEPQADINVSYLVMTMVADEEHFEESNFRSLLDAFESQGGDVIILMIPNESVQARRSIDRVLQGKQIRGLPWGDIAIRVVLTTEKMRDLAALARLTGTPREIKDAAESLGLTYGISNRFEKILDSLHRAGKTLPYRWDVKRVGQNKEQTFGIYQLLSERFTDEEFTGPQAANWVAEHYHDVPMLKDAPEKGRYMSERAWAEYSTSLTLEILEGQTLAQKKGTAGDRYYIPALVPYEKELYDVVLSKREGLAGQNPGTDDIKGAFFGLRKARGYDIWAIAVGMEGKGYLQSYQEGTRRFYRPFEPHERRTAVEIDLSRFEKQLPDTISQRLAEDKISLTKAEVEAFAGKLQSSSKDRFERARKYLNDSQIPGEDVFRRLHSIAKAKLEVILLQDYANTQIANWSAMQNALDNLEPSLTRKEGILDRLVNSKRLAPKRAAEIRAQFDEFRSTIPKIKSNLNKFEAEKARELYTSISIQIAKIDGELNERLGDLADAEKQIQEAQTNLQTIAKAIDPRSPASKSLGLDNEYSKLEEQLEAAQSVSAKGKSPEQVPTEDLNDFVSRFVDPKLEETRGKLEALRRAESLLGALGQSDEADDLRIKTGKIEGLLEKAQRTRTQNLLNPFMDLFAHGYEQAIEASKTIDWLVSAF